MARATFVKKARKDVAGTDIKKGDSYYWWAFKFRGRICSKTAPKRSQLTQSSFKGQIYDIEDRISSCDFESVKSVRDDIISELESLRDECQDKHNTMPEQLQDTSSSGQLLQERVERLDEMISELEGLDLDFDIDEEKADDETEEEAQERIDTEKEEKMDEFRSVSYQGG